MISDSEIEYLRKRWFETFDTYEWFSVFRVQYSNSSRHYHGLNHILHMLLTQEQYFPQMSKAGIAAIFFHDIEYNPISKLNEYRSAETFLDFWEQFLSHTELNPELVVRYILDTINHDHYVDETSAQVCDLDLFGLSAAWGVYSTNTAKIRAEYHMVSDELWVAGRIAFLEERMKRPVYGTPEMADIECFARVNMEAELTQLQNWKKYE